MNLLYGIKDKPPLIKTLLFALQQMCSVFVATVLIANICGTPTDACLFGACVGTLLYQLITKGQSPMFISSCGATVSAVCGALAINNTGGNYFAVALGGVVVFIVYSLIALLVKLRGVKALDKILPPIIIGPITMVIGANLAKFIATYVLVGGEHNDWGIAIAIFTMVVIAVSSHYFKGFWKTIPFLLGLISGYILSLILTVTGIAPILNWVAPTSMLSLPDFSFLHWDVSQFSIELIIEVIVLFAPVALCGICEHCSDHAVLSNIIGTNLLETPGLDKTLLGDGAASLLGTIVCGLPNTSYGESIATTGFSRVASRYVITFAALMLGLMSFITPIQAVIASIPSCVFGGCAMVLYGYIFASGLKTLIRYKADLEDNKNLIIASVILTVGVSGIWLFSEAFAAVSLAMVLGVMLNLILKNKS